MKTEKIILLQSLLSPEEHNAILNEMRDKVEDDKLLHYLLGNDFFFKLNLNEKHQETALIDFIVQRAFELDMEFSKDINTLHKKIKNVYRKKDFLPLELNQYTLQKLKKTLHKDYTIGSLNKADDFVYLCILKKKNLKKLRNLHFPFGDFEKISDTFDQDN
ncbi:MULTISPECIES: hypothetical protein [Myroides]|uniref:Uncharacterized protein n=1 Tax=Myroides albus TaxID=2562892 RepID=A0A6I3LI68_9FLAO|nr:MULTISPECIES: hypothetical protein [Myroides]MTG99289.1 hypothetical protein [Myroides albus]MVX36995.1 hypothetical protein [Myroides sp. LoEW2-1]UVD79824.1 hypothetical protein NWE55_00580 [Myroides albus]